jgi:hypothetical protein
MIEPRQGVIRLEAVQLRRIAADALRQLHVADSADVRDVRELTDGTWMVGFEDRFPDTRFPGFEIGIQQEWSPEEALRELRRELRRKLWICPLCQHRSLIRRIVDREVFRIECDECGRFEIAHTLLEDLRGAYEANEPGVVGRLPRLSNFVRRSAAVPFLSTDNWVAFADDTDG